MTKSNIDIFGRINLKYLFKDVKRKFFLLCLFAVAAQSAVDKAFATSASWNYSTNTGTLGTTYSWIDCTNGGTAIDFFDYDDGATSINWPFNFKFYDDSYTTSNSLSVCTNGFIRLDGTANTSSSTASNYTLGSLSTELGQIIATSVYDCEIIGDVMYMVTGTAPYRIFTIEYYRINPYNSSKTATVEVSFYETTGKIVLKLLNKNINTSGIDMGIHSGVNGFYNKWQEIRNATANTWIEYTPPNPVVEVSATSGTSSATYSTLKTAFDKINDGTHKGDISVKIKGNTAETATAALNASGSGSASYSSVKVYPTVDNVSVSGSVDGPLVNLSGADNVTFDGRVNASDTIPKLTISNTSTSASAITVQFTVSAQNDRINLCKLLGGGGSSTNGTLMFGSGTNTGNVIDSCEITNNGTRRINAIYSATGTNTGNTIRSNKIYDNWNTASSSNSVCLSTGSSGWTISGNSFYATSDFEPTGGTYAYSAVYIDNTSGGGFDVSGNYVGGKQPLCGGQTMNVGVGSSRSLIMYPVYINAGTSSATSVQGNIIRNIAYKSTSSTPFAGIYINAGNVNVGTNTGNVIGDSTGTGSVYITSTVSSPVSYGIYAGSTGTISVSNNTIGSITTANTSSSYPHGFTGIYKASQSGDITISGNKIGSDHVAGSIQTSSSATGYSQYLFGINSAGTGNTTINGNTVANLTNSTTETTVLSKMYGIYTTAGTNVIQGNKVHDLTTGGSASADNYENVAMTGIFQYSMTGSQSITGNAVYNLISTTSSPVEFYGILHWGSTSGNDVIAGNFIHGFKMLTSSTTCYLHGISIFDNSGTFSGSVTTYNNIVFLGDSITVGCNIFGIVKNSLKACNFYHNTIHLGGTVSDGSTTSSYAFRDKTDGSPATRDIRNNIFYNTRSGGGSNYAIYFYVTGNIVIDYNDYGWSGTYFAQVNSPTTQLVTLQQWLNTIGQDSHSITLNPQFTKIDGYLATDYKTNVGLDGVPGTGITLDFAGQTRSTGSPTMGAWECFPVEVYNGSIYRASYFTLKDAFNAINNGVWKNDLTVKMKGSTQETSTAVLNESGSGSAYYSSVKIYPTRKDVVIRGNLDGSVVRLNGADNVMFDGRVDTTGTTAGMTIANLNTGVGASTFKFVNSAQHDVLYYCNIKGAGASDTVGVINFSTSSSGTGNSSNTISKCIITGTAQDTRPVNAIYSAGTSGKENSGNVVNSNSIMNNWRSGSSSYSINLGPGTSGWTISYNSFYDSTAFVPSGSYSYYAVYINGTGVNYTITGNYIGGKMAQCLGSALTVGSSSYSSTYCPVYLKVGTSTASSVQGNRINNIKVTSASANPFVAIYIADGSVNVGTTSANIIGAVAGTDAVYVSSSASSATSYGIYTAGSGSINISGNNIGSWDLANSNSGNAHSFKGIYNAGSGSVSVISNTIGSTTTAGSIEASSTSSGYAQALSAIEDNGTGTLLAKGNTIINLVNSSVDNVSGNEVTGIKKTGSGSVTIMQNYISNLSSAATSTANVIAGFYLGNGASACSNNVINIGGNSTGYSLVYGIYTAGTNGYTDNIYHNTVYVSGTTGGTSSTAYTYCFFKKNNSGSSNIKNNIFYNARTSGNSSSRHYAASLPGVSGVGIDGNDYFCNGQNGMLGNFGGTDKSTLVLWKASTGQDAVSISSTPGFLNEGGTSALDYKIGAVLDGVAGTGITIDFGGNSRSTTSPTIGAWEYSLCVEVYKGVTLIGAYSTLKGAFDRINAGNCRGVVTVKIYKSTYETSTAALNVSNDSVSNVLIYPVRDSVVVAGSLDAPLVNVSGTDNVRFDGRVGAAGSTPSLVLSNTNTGINASTIQFSQAAQHDTVNYCYIKGAGLGTATGTVNFSASSSVGGNSSNIIDNCMISGENSIERPMNAIYSLGSSSYENSNNTLSNNCIYDFLMPGSASNGINIGSRSTGFKITGNSFYGTAVLTTTAEAEYAAIRIDNSSGNSFIITDNNIGGNAPGCSGTFTKIGSNNRFCGIYLNVGTTSATSVQNNVIRNISFTNSGNADFTGIYVAGGMINIGNLTANIIGSSEGNGSIKLTNGSSGGSFYGIDVEGSGSVTCQNNIIGSITTNNSDQSYATNIYAINKSTISGNLTVGSNMIGSTSTSNSVQAASNAYANSQSVYGIYSAGTGAIVISDNNISNLSNLTVETTKSSMIAGIFVSSGSNTIQGNAIDKILNGGAANGGSGTSAPNFGIADISSTSGQTITGNTIANISNTSTAKIYVYGLYYSGPTGGTNIISKNFISNFLLPVAPPESYVQAITILRGIGSVYNNIVAVGDSIAKGCSIFGLLVNNTNSMSYYHNTIYIGGTVASAYNPTYAFRDETSSPSGNRDIRNNVFSNQRSGGGTHYAIHLSSTSALTINYNDYYAGGTNGVLGYFSYQRTTLSAWQSATGQDGQSLNSNPVFLSAGSTSPADYTPTASMSGLSGLGITDDYAGTVRQNPPTMGALEFSGYYWTGNLDTDWSKSDNWLPKKVPTILVHANIPQRTNQPNINSGTAAEVGSMVIYSGAIVTINGGGSLTVASNLVNNAGTTGLVINSTAEGTGSFIYSGDNVYATVKRYIPGKRADWHFLSAPVSGQAIHGTSWTPSGSYGDGTGYDMYVWNEPTSCWIYNLNNTVSPTWSSIHPDDKFIPGRGYLYAVLDSFPTKEFAGYLNNGTISQNLTILADTARYRGFNFIGNPYPSSIDWKVSDGFTRSMLTSDGGGYDIWTWSSTAENYGVYNSADGTDYGTNNVSRYIAPMQGFFVYASSAGTFAFNNAARVHNGASVWLKSADVSDLPGAVSLIVSSGSGYGSDEIKINFGSNINADGAPKLFSPVKTAPSLYMPYNGNDFSTCRLTNANDNPITYVSFKAGCKGDYTLKCLFDASVTGNVYLEDLKTGEIHDFSSSGEYSFTSSKEDAAGRFVLHYGSVIPVGSKIDADVYVSSNDLVVDLSKLGGVYPMQIYDAGGRLVYRDNLNGGERFLFPLKERGLYIVTLRSKNAFSKFKAMY